MRESTPAGEGEEWSTPIDPNNSGVTETVSLGNLMACRPRGQIKADLAIKLLSYLQPSVCPTVRYPYNANGHASGWPSSGCTCSVALTIYLHCSHRVDERYER